MSTRMLILSPRKNLLKRWLKMRSKAKMVACIYYFLCLYATMPSHIFFVFNKFVSAISSCCTSWIQQPNFIYDCQLLFPLGKFWCSLYIKLLTYRDYNLFRNRYLCDLRRGSTNAAWHESSRPGSGWKKQTHYHTLPHKVWKSSCSWC